MDICSDSLTEGVIVGIIAGVAVVAILWLLRKFYKAIFIEPIKTIKENRQIRKLLLRRNYYLIFNPTSGKRKPIGFGNNGQITDGQNDNEHTWKVHKRKLEIYGNDGLIYSRFNYDHQTDKFVNNNDPDTRSIRDQFIEPKWEKASTK